MNMTAKDSAYAEDEVLSYRRLQFSLFPSVYNVKKDDYGIDDLTKSDLCATITHD